MKQKLRTRIGSMMLAVIMVLSLLPVTALAEYDTDNLPLQPTSSGIQEVEENTTDVAQIGESKYDTLSEALNAVKDGETIKVLASATVEMTDTYEITDKAITLDLNGQTVTWKSSAKNMIEIGADGGLTIQDATDAGVLHFIGTGTTSYGSGIYTSGNSSLSLTGGTVLYEHSMAGYGLNITGSSTFTMTGGTVKITGAVSHAVRLASTSQCQLNGGKILFDEATTATTLYGVYAILFSAGDAAGFSLGNLTVDGSMVPDTKTVVCVYGYNSSTPVTISGGSYTANSKSASYAVGGDSSNNTAISGGTFNGAVKAAIGKVTGGLFSVQPSAAYLHEGKIYELQQDGYYHVVDGTYVARLGTVGYTSWEALWNDASEGTTASAVYILANVDEITVPAGKNVIFYNSGNCTIGKITNNGTCKIISYAMTGTEVVNNGSLNLGHEVKSLVNNQGATMVATGYIYAKVTDSITNSGTMTISKGAYPCTITNTGTITLTGGSFAQEVKDWCAEGYTTQKSGELWTVVKNGDHVAEIDGYWYTSLSAAINAAKGGDTVKLLMDTTLTPPTTGTGLKSAITISGVSKPNLTLDLNGKTISWDQTYASQTLSTTPVMFSITGGANITITGNGTIDTELGSNASYGINMTASTKNQLTIENGTFTGAPTAIQVEKGTLTILDGTFKLAETVATDKPEQAKYVVNAIDANWKDGTAKIKIQGGTFCYDPSANPEGQGTTYLMNGYQAISSNGMWTVSATGAMAAEIAGKGAYETVFAAMDAAADGDTVTLLSKYEGEAVTVSKAITVDLAETGTASDKFVPTEAYQMTTEGTKLVFALKTLTVAFNSNGGSAVASQTVTYNTAATEPPAPTRSGYTFDGWYSDEALTSAYNFSTPVTGDITLYAKWTYVDSGSSGGSSSGGSSSSGTTTETEKNPDGSTTTTVTKPDGTVTETTKQPDGSTTQVVTKPDGSSTTTVDNKDGSSSTTTVSKDGQVEAEVKLSTSVVEDAADKGETVALPMPEVPVTSDQQSAPTITVDLPSNTSAKVEIPVADVTAGTVAILVKADGTEQVIKTTLTTENGVAVTLADGDTVKIVDNSKDFDDVEEDYWGSSYIDFATSRELFSGTSESTFSPETVMTRGMIVTVLAAYDGADTTAAASEVWYAAGQKWAMLNGISDGTTPNGSITREQLAVMLWNYAGKPTPTGDLSSYIDADSTSDWAVEALAWAVENGLISGMGNGALNPQGNATRAQVATIMTQFVALTA